MKIMHHRYSFPCSFCQNVEFTLLILRTIETKSHYFQNIKFIYSLLVIGIDFRPLDLTM